MSNRLNLKTLCTMLGLLAIMLAACSVPGGQIDPTSTPGPDEPIGSDTPVPTPAEPTGNVVNGIAVVESLEIRILESFPVQVHVVASGNLPDGCTTVDEATQIREGNTFEVTITTVRPADAFCTQALVPFEEVIPLEVVGLEAGTYTVIVNGVSDSFTLDVDNVLPDSASRPDEAILLLEPGPGSSVTSPVHVAGEANPTFEQSLVVQISDEDGIVIATVPTQIQADTGQRGPFSVDVPFSVVSDQPGRISIFSDSARDGGLEHLASAEVTLLASGTASINPGPPHPETIAIFEPALVATVSGGTLHITGFSEYVFEGHLGIVICGEGGSGAFDLFCGSQDNVIATAVTIMDAPDAGQPGPFTADVAYTVSAPVQARIAVYNGSPRDGGILHLSSVNVTLAP